jgi:hypothetical protein
MVETGIVVLLIREGYQFMYVCCTKLEERNQHVHDWLHVSMCILSSKFPMQ